MLRKRAFDILVAGILAYVAIACSGRINQTASRVLKDAGQALADAGQALADAGVDAGRILQDAGQALGDGSIETATDGGRDAISEASAQVDAPGYVPMTSGSRLTSLQQTWVGEDGSTYSQPSYSFHDNTLGIDCQAGLASDYKMRCLPTFNISSGYFTDSACTISAGLIPSCNTSPPKYGKVLNTYDACNSGTTYRVHKIGSKLNNVYVKSGDNCVQTTAPSGMTYVSIGSEVSPSTFVQFTKQ